MSNAATFPCAMSLRPAWCQRALLAASVAASSDTLQEGKGLISEGGDSEAPRERKETETKNGSGQNEKRPAAVSTQCDVRKLRAASHLHSEPALSSTPPPSPRLALAASRTRAAACLP